MDFSASGLYGGPAPVQPTPNAIPGHAGGPEPMARTTPLPGNSLNNPTLILVGLLGLAILLINVSVGFNFKVSK